MKIVASFVVCLFLMLSFSHVAYGQGKEKKEKEKKEEQNSDTCMAAPVMMGGSALLVEASSTGSIRHNPVRVHQFYKEKCHTEQNMRYRTPDGTCNHHLNRGAANTPFIRLRPPLYGDVAGINAPRTHGKDGYPLPSATDVSRAVHTNKSVISDHTAMFMQWGQFVDHDLALTPVHTNSEGEVKCCGANGTMNPKLVHPDCFPIIVNESDARFVGDCMNFTRSVPALNMHGVQSVPREQVNELTHFLDGSNIYGSSLQAQLQLRETTKDGKPGAELRTERNELLPNISGFECHHLAEDYCFGAGDRRVNVQPGLIIIHTIWVRLHNWVVKKLRKVLEDDDEEELFQTARKIVIALYQHIHYQEWLPHVIGSKLHGSYRLYPETRFDGRFSYSASTDPRITNEFATAAFRFGHTLLPDSLVVNGTAHEFRSLFFDPSLVFEDYNSVLNALLNAQNSAQTVDRFMVDELTEHLFEVIGQVRGAPSHALDLAALNIQRGRDHGLRPYNDYRKACGLEPYKNFSDFGEAADVLRSVYRSVEDVDLFVGGLQEEAVAGDAVLGPTFACIVAQQFHALKFGDLFYYETDRQDIEFTNEQLQAIRKVTFGQVICLTTDDPKLEYVRKNVFFATSKEILCSDFDTFDLKLWKRKEKKKQE